MARKAVPTPPQRMLRVYAFDPSRGTRLENHFTISVPYEKLKKGPVGRKIAVIDYDASNRCYYEGADLDALAVLAQGGLAPSESNPQFHQQMVYAVVMDTVRRFEAALGREIKWRADRGTKEGNLYHGKLKIYPHAMQEANAFYDPELRALLFGYFKASDENAGSNLPGQVVYTCLSHDIIVHETTHAILDGIREPSWQRKRHAGRRGQGAAGIWSSRHGAHTSVALSHDSTHAATRGSTRALRGARRCPQ